MNNIRIVHKITSLKNKAQFSKKCYSLLELHKQVKNVLFTQKDTTFAEVSN